jgi:FKBP-type peptidyl-prolyl isomerase-like protein
MSVTAVPLRPLKKGSVPKLWIGLAVLVLAAAAIAWWGTAGQQIHTTRSGLRYQIVKEGTGPQPTPADVVAFNYEGRLEDGKVFDTSKGRQPMVTGVTELVPGFTEGLQLMKKGGRYRLWIPPELGYPGGSGPIPPNATLTFDVELLEVVPRSALQGMMPPQGPPPEGPPPGPPPGLPGE